MKYADLVEAFTNGSESFRRANSHLISSAKTNSPSPASVTKRGPLNGPLAAPQTQTGNSGRYIISLTSYRVRLLDEDNLVSKWHVDALRYAGCIPGDSPDIAHIVTTQKKVAKRVQERTEIIVEASA